MSESVLPTETLFKPCAVVPVYNHHEKLDRVIASLQAHNLHCILVNDGSNDVTTKAITQMADQHTDISLYHLIWNQGKGSAVMEGLMLAQQAGFTHAVQIDADGQHDSNALPELLESAEQCPGTLITGKPVYDACAPKSRLYGRKITQFWVCIETLSRDIEDAMIGFRVYPLKATCQLIRDVDITRRMDFDIDIIVRLNWAGMPIKSVPVKISYPEDGISHFNAVADNIRISALHTRLFFGMLRRSPSLIRRFSKRHSEHWADAQERGSQLGIRFLLTVYRLLGNKAFTMMLMPVMAYFYATGRTARTASLDYLSKLYAVTPEALPHKPDNRLSFKHFIRFGHSLADRFGAWLGKIPLSQLEIRGKEALEEKLNSGRGAVLLVSHLGNIELCRALANIKQNNKALPVNVLVHTRHAPSFNKIMEDVNPDSNIRLIQVDTIGPDTSIMLSDMIERGEMVAIAADRVATGGSQNTSVTAQFLGHDALFPKGPFVLASVLRCPVFTLFCTRQNISRLNNKQQKQYLLDIEPFADPLVLPRKQRNEYLTDYAQQYASRLEAVCLRSPLEWFNFFDFWQAPGENK